MRDIKPVAVVMNMYYTGLGIARSLGEHGVPVVGLSASGTCYGNFTRYARTVRCPDSRSQPEQLLDFLLQLGPTLGAKSVLFPTRDDDVIFLDRFRDQLEPWFRLVLPSQTALRWCLDKWESFLAAKRAGVRTPQCWLISNQRDLGRILPEVRYPCVLKPVAAADWRKGNNWGLVGGRKAIPVSSEQELLAEYNAVAAAEERALLQALVPGGDDRLVIAACYMDRHSRYVAGFNTQKLLQVPESFGTGCIVQAADCPDLQEPTVRLLQSISFTGIAEVEFKWDEAERQFKLIEVNPRAWDQHRLGKSCGTDLALLAYHEHAGLEMPVIEKRASRQKWVAEDVFVLTALRSFVKRDSKWRGMLRLARGNRLYAIWSARDPLPAVAYAIFNFIPNLVRTGIQVAQSTLGKRRVLVVPRKA
jgi:predicted ATP-grasp superfamily ATP-dependent carboligase